MHEFSIASNIIDSLKSRFQHESVQLTEINLQIGKLTCVLPDSLKFCFDSFKHQPLIKNAILNIEILDGKGYCSKCEKHFPMPALYTICPECSTPGMEIIQGNELKIISVEVEDNV